MLLKQPCSLVPVRTRPPGAGMAGRPVFCGSTPTPPGAVEGGLAVLSVTAPRLTVVGGWGGEGGRCLPGGPVRPTRRAETPAPPLMARLLRRRLRRLASV